MAEDIGAAVERILRDPAFSGLVRELGGEDVDLASRLPEAMKLLGPLLGIKDPKADPRITYIGGIKGLGELQRRVESGTDMAAFSMYPTSMEELFRVTDAGLIMPPKSTWFEPKLQSGLFVHRI